MAAAAAAFLSAALAAAAAALVWGGGGGGAGAEGAAPEAEGPEGPLTRVAKRAASSFRRQCARARLRMGVYTARPLPKSRVWTASKAASQRSVAEEEDDEEEAEEGRPGRGDASRGTNS